MMFRCDDCANESDNPECRSCGGRMRLYGLESDWRGVVREAIRRYRLPSHDDGDIAKLVIGALEGHGFVARPVTPPPGSDEEEA